MAIIFEDTKNVLKKKIPITDKEQKECSNTYNALKKTVPKNNLKALKFFATKKTYNRKGIDSKRNGEINNGEMSNDGKTKYVTVDKAKSIVHQRPPYLPNKIYDLLNKGIQRARSQEKVSPVEPPKPTSNAKVKPSDVKQKKISTPNGDITYSVTAENKVIDWAEQVKKSQKKIYISEKKLLKLKNDFI